MKEIINFYRGQRGSKKRKLSRLFFIFIIVFAYNFFFLVWHPQTFVSILGSTQIITIAKLIVALLLSGYISLMLDMHFFRKQNNLKRQIRDFRMWNKFILHFAFLKTGSSDEKNKVLDSLKYLEESKLKDSLYQIYDESESLKDAHQKVYEKYPYPQIKTFFSEAENALVSGVDENALMQRTALNIDKYVRDLIDYEESKEVGYKTSVSLIILVFGLLALAKILLPEVVNTMGSTIGGFIVMTCGVCLLHLLLVKVKAAYVSPLVTFGGDDNE